MDHPSIRSAFESHSLQRHPNTRRRISWWSAPRSLPLPARKDLRSDSTRKRWDMPPDSVHPAIFDIWPYVGTAEKSSGCLTKLAQRRFFAAPGSGIEQPYQTGHQVIALAQWELIRYHLPQAPQGINTEGQVNMALTRDFKETVAARVQNDPAFAQALLDEAITLFVNGEPESAKLILRDLVNATVGFEALAEEIHKPAKSLHRMLSQSGNPTMSNISAVFAAIKRALKVEVRTQVVMA